MSLNEYAIQQRVEAWNSNKPILALVFALFTVFLTVPTFATSSFTASLTCTGPKFGVIGGSFAYWNWTVNGVSIGPFIQTGIFASSGVIHCNSTGGGPNTTTASGTQPSNANGILVRVTSQIKGCYHTTIATQSFSPGQSISIKASATCTRVSYGVVVTETGSFTLIS